MKTNSLNCGSRVAWLVKSGSLVRHPRASLCLVLLASCGLVATMPQAAQARSSVAVQRRANALVDEAARHYLAGQYSRALLMCVQATQIAPDYPRAWVGLGKTQAALDQRDEAGRAFRQALKVGAQGMDATRARNGLRALGLPIKEPRPKPLTIPVRGIAPIKSWTPVKTIMVSPDGANKSIAQAIRNAPPFSRIEIAAGNYHESLNVNKPLQIVGSKLGDVIIESIDAPCLSLRANGATISQLVFKAKVSIRGNNRFHAVEIPSGRSLLSDCEVQTDSRVGISAYGSSTQPWILRCKVSGARTSGIIVYNRAHADIDNCDISGAAYSGLEVFEAGDAFVRGSSIHENRTGVVAETTSTALLQDCTVEKNVWQGVRVEPYGNLFLRRTIVQNNTHEVSIGTAGRFLAAK